MSTSVLLPDVRATEAWGEEIGKEMTAARRGGVLAIEGPMGAGKTAWVRGLARGLGAKGSVASPTFQILRIHDGPIPLWHVDLFRLPAASEEIHALGIREAVAQGAVVAVEWADRAPVGALEDARRIRIDYDGDARRGFLE